MVDEVEVEGLEEASGAWPNGYSDVSDQSKEGNRSSESGGPNTGEADSGQRVGDGNSVNFTSYRVTRIPVPP
ncbi:hypothetical protein PIB30_021095 [Stylosanthes scabra]|uniref:Uncharacterized protein n=1 Tax=Stylosanthes scabra TaxID=79078 RepID=A0ABU6Y5Z5_9FABA|nr:hypothetical protein [Stylosanthes scabra]